MLYSTKTNECSGNYLQTCTIAKIENKFDFSARCFDHHRPPHLHWGGPIDLGKFKAANGNQP